MGFQLDAVKVDGRTAVSTISAILDSGTSLIAFPQEQVQAITSMIGGYVAQDCSNLDSLRTITFVIGGIDYPLTPRQYVLQENGYCQLGIQPSSTVIIGDVFMRQYYSVFDMEQNRIGLANADWEGSSWQVVNDAKPTDDSNSTGNKGEGKG